jgi:hypothetical protein
MTTDKRQDPSKRLAIAILERLVREQLLSKSEARKLVPGLAGGKLKPQDWRHAIELSARK